MAKDLVWAMPPYVKQNYDHTCWAAVMESFLASSPGRPKLDQEQVFTQFSKYALDDESMGRPGLRILFRDPRWGLKQMECPADAFTGSAEFLYQKLTAGNVILGYWEPKISGWHVGLAFGLRGRAVSYMNPDSNTGGLLSDDLNYFGRQGPLMVAWRAW